MKNKTLKHLLLAAVLLMICAISLCGCGTAPIHEGETYLEGSFYFSDGGLDAGYNLFADGSGFQFIGSTINPIRYGVFEGNIYISVNGGPAVEFPFSQNEDGILIGGLLYQPVEENQEVAESIAQAVSEAEKAEETGISADEIVFYVTVVISFGLVFLIVIWLVRMIKKREGKL